MLKRQNATTQSREKNEGFTVKINKWYENDSLSLSVCVCACLVAVSRRLMEHSAQCTAWWANHGRSTWAELSHCVSLFLLRWCVVVDASAFINTSSLYYCCAIMIMSKPFFSVSFVSISLFFTFCKWKIKMLCPASGLHHRHRQMADQMRFIHNSLRACVTSHSTKALVFSSSNSPAKVSVATLVHLPFFIISFCEPVVAFTLRIIVLITSSESHVSLSTHIQCFSASNNVANVKGSFFLSSDSYVLFSQR